VGICREAGDRSSPIEEPQKNCKPAHPSRSPAWLVACGEATTTLSDNGKSISRHHPDRAGAPMDGLRRAILVPSSGRGGYIPEINHRSRQHGRRRRLVRTHYVYNVAPHDARR